MTVEGSDVGANCSFAHGHRLADTCNTEECPVDCEGEWGSWSPCSITCGSNGNVTRVFNVSTEASSGGIQCNASDSAIEIQLCNASAPCENRHESSTSSAVSVTTSSPRTPSIPSVDSLLSFYEAIQYQGLGSSAFRKSPLDVAESGVLAQDYQSTFANLFSQQQLIVTAEMSNLESSESTITSPAGGPIDLFLRARTQAIDSETKLLVLYVWASYSSSSISSATIYVDVNTDAFSATYQCSTTLKSLSGTTCEIEIDGSFFTDTPQQAQIQAKVGNSQVASEVALIQLGPTLSYGNSDSCMFLKMPSFALMTGSTLQTKLYANTSLPTGNLYSLSVWSVSVQFPATLDLVEITSDNYDISFDLNEDIGDGLSEVAMVATYKAAAVDDISGSRLLVAEIEFSVTVDAPALVPQLVVHGMVSTAGNRIASNITGYVAINSSFVQEGSMLFVSEGVVGVLAYVDGDLASTTQVNSYPVGTQPQAIGVAPLAVMSCHVDSLLACVEDSSVADASDLVSCTSSNTLILGCEGPTVTFPSANPQSGNVSLTFELGEYTFDIAFQVWVPINVQILLDDPVLNLITGTCGDVQFQQTTLRVVGTLQCGTDSIESLDLLPIAQPLTNSSNVAIDDNSVIAYGNDTFTATISVGDTVELVTTSSVPVTVVAIDAFAFNALDMQLESGTTGNSYGSFALEPSLSHSLTAEGDTTGIYAAVSFSDGFSNIVTSGLSITSLKPEILTVSSQENTVPEVVVVQNAVSSVGYDLAEVRWAPCGNDLAVGAPIINVSLPAPVSIAVSVSDDTIVHTDDLLAQSPTNWPTETEVSVLVFFADGSYRDFSDDDRVTLSCTNCNLLFNENVISLNNSNLDGQYEATFTVSLGDYSSLQATQTVLFDEFLALETSTAAYPSCTSDACSNKTEVFPIQLADGVYQRLQLSVSARSALGQTQALSWSSNTLSLSLSATDVLSIDSMELTDNILTDVTSPRVYIVPVQTGSCNVVVDWYGASATKVIKVAGTPTVVSAISNMDQSSTISETQFAEVGLLFRVSFDDGTSFSIDTADRGVGPSWIEDLYFVDVAATNAGSLTVDNETKMLTVLDNTPGMATAAVSISSTQDASVVCDIEYFVNLVPEQYDIDMGATVGPPFGVDATEESEFDVAVRFCTDSNALTAFEITVYYNASLLDVKAVEAGANWPYTVTSVIGDPFGEVGLIGSELESEVGIDDDIVEIAVITFSWKAGHSGASSDISAFVVASTTVGNELLGSSGRASISGSGVLSGNSDLQARRLQPDAKRRVLTDCTSDNMPKGDANGDCTFNVLDLNTIKMFFLGQDIVFQFEEAQMQEMDPNFDGYIDTLDISFLLSALSKTYRFLLESAQPSLLSIVGCNVAFEATFVDKFSNLLSDSQATKVQLEVASTRDLSGIQSALLSDDGHAILDMDGPYLGKFNTSFALPVKAVQTLDIVMLVTVYTQDGETDETRMFPWRSSTYGAFGNNFFSFVPWTTQQAASCASTTTDTTDSTLPTTEPSPAPTTPTMTASEPAWEPSSTLAVSTAVVTSISSASSWPPTTHTTTATSPASTPGPSTLQSPGSTTTVAAPGTTVSATTPEAAWSSATAPMPLSPSSAPKTSTSSGGLTTTTTSSPGFTTPTSDTSTSSDTVPPAVVSITTGLDQHTSLPVVDTSAEADQTTPKTTTTDISVAVTQTTRKTATADTSPGVDQATPKVTTWSGTTTWATPSVSVHNSPSTSTQTSTKNPTTTPVPFTFQPVVTPTTSESGETTLGDNGLSAAEQAAQAEQESRDSMIIIIVIIVVVVVIVIVVVVIVVRRRGRKNKKKKVNPRDAPHNLHANAFGANSTTAGIEMLASPHADPFALTGYVQFTGLDIAQIRTISIQRAVQAALAGVPVHTANDLQSSDIVITDNHEAQDSSVTLRFGIRSSAEITGANLPKIRRDYIEALDANSSLRCQPLLDAIARHARLEGADDSAWADVAIVDAGLDDEAKVLSPGRRRRTPRSRRHISPKRLDAVSTVVEHKGQDDDDDDDDANAVVVGGTITVSDIKEKDFQKEPQLRDAFASAIKSIAQDDLGVVGGSCQITSTSAAPNGDLDVEYKMKVPGGNVGVANESALDLTYALQNDGVAFVGRLQEELQNRDIAQLNTRHITVVDHKHEVDGEAVAVPLLQTSQRVHGKIVLDAVSGDDILNDSEVSEAIIESLREAADLGSKATIVIDDARERKGKTKVKYHIDVEDTEARDVVQRALDGNEDVFTESLQARARRNQGRSKALKQFTNMKVAQMAAECAPASNSQNALGGAFVSGSVVVRGIDAVDFNNDSVLQEAMQSSLESLPDVSRSGFNKSRALVTGAEEQLDGSLKINYRLKLENEVDNSQKEEIQKNIDDSFQDGGIEFLSTLKAQSMKRGSRMSSNINRLQSIDSTHLEMVQSRTRGRRRFGAGVGALDDDATVNVSGVFRFAGIRKADFVKNSDVQSAFISTITQLAADKGIKIARNEFQFVGIRTQADAALKVSFKITTPGIKAKDADNLASATQSLCANGGVGFLRKVNAHIVSKPLDVASVRVQDGSSLRCTKARLRSAIKSVMNATRTRSGFEGMASAKLALHAKKDLALRGEGRLQSYALLDKESGELGGESTGISSRRARRRRAARGELQREDEEADVGKAEALRRRRERRKRRLRRKAGENTAASLNDDQGDVEVSCTKHVLLSLFISLPAVRFLFCPQMHINPNAVLFLPPPIFFKDDVMDFEADDTATDTQGAPQALPRRVRRRSPKNTATSVTDATIADDDSSMVAVARVSRRQFTKKSRDDAKEQPKESNEEVVDAIGSVRSRRRKERREERKAKRQGATASNNGTGPLPEGVTEDAVEEVDDWFLKNEDIIAGVEAAELDASPRRTRRTRPVVKSPAKEAENV